MSTIEYVPLSNITPAEWLPLLNKPKIREHLIDHAMFDIHSVTEWVNGKSAVDASPGCRVRAIKINNELAGWCGIQREQGNYELAIIIDDHAWGLGKRIYQDMMRWAKEMGHQEVVIHFLETRREYRFLRKIATSVYESELMGRRFTTYLLPVT